MRESAGSQIVALRSKSLCGIPGVRQIGCQLWRNSVFYTCCAVIKACKSRITFSLLCSTSLRNPQWSEGRVWDWVQYLVAQIFAWECGGERVVYLHQKKKSRCRAGRHCMSQLHSYQTDMNLTVIERYQTKIRGRNWGHVHNDFYLTHIPRGILHSSGICTPVCPWQVVKVLPHRRAGNPSNWMFKHNDWWIGLGNFRLYRKCLWDDIQVRTSCRDGNARRRSVIYVTVSGLAGGEGDDATQNWPIYCNFSYLGLYTNLFASLSFFKRCLIKLKFRKY